MQNDKNTRKKPLSSGFFNAYVFYFHGWIGKISKPFFNRGRTGGYALGRKKKGGYVYFFCSEP